MTIHLDEQDKRIKSGLCPQHECGGFLILVKQSGDHREYKCSDCAQEAATNFPVPIPEHIN